jgi:hypothetical protein
VTITDTVTQADRHQAAVSALLALVRETPATGLAEFHLSDGELGIQIHDNPAGFEWWREALGLPPDATRLTDYRTFTTIDLPGQVGSLRVRLVAYLPPLPKADDADTTETHSTGSGS